MEKKNVALVLSSGGARGIAHIGVIEELLARGYNITSVAGTSIGAIIGGFYAAGKLDDYANWVYSLGLVNVFNLIDFSFSAKGVIKGQKVFKKMSEWMEGLHFEDLSIPFTCVATDLKNRRERVFDSGDVLQAMRASISIPGYIEPLLVDDVFLYDGGIVNPIPLNRVQRKDDDIVVAVDLNTYQPDFDPKRDFKGHEDTEASQTLNKVTSMWLNAIKNIEVLQRRTSNEKKKAKEEVNKDKHLTRIGALTEMFDMMQENISKQMIAQEAPDILIEIPRNLCSTFEFHKSKELVEFGRMRAKMALDMLDC